MKYLVLLFYLFSPAHMQDYYDYDYEEMTPEEKVQDEIFRHEKTLENSKRELASVKGHFNATLLKKQNYTDILQQEKVRNQEYIANTSQLRKDFETCENDLAQCKDQTKAIPKPLNDEKFKLGELKKEKERLLREIEKCQPVSKSSTVLVPESSTVLVPQSSTSSGSTCFLNNLIDYKSSVIYNLLSGIFGLVGKRS